MFLCAHPKRHLDRFSRFCEGQERDQQTQTHRQTTLLLCNNIPHLAIAEIQPKCVYYRYDE